MKELLLVLALPVFALAVILTLLLSTGGDIGSFKRQCGAQGGHMYGTGLYLCLTKDGRVIEVYP